jgi:hypothetical protein
MNRAAVQDPARPRNVSRWTQTALDSAMNFQEAEKPKKENETDHHKWAHHSFLMSNKLAHVQPQRCPKWQTRRLPDRFTGTPLRSTLSSN